MLNIDSDLISYKKIVIDSESKLKFFLQKHSTKEGTWGVLQLEAGEIEFVVLDGSEQELASYKIDKNNPRMNIPPALWHKIRLIKKDRFRATLQFYCKLHRYFNMKYGLGNVHSDLYYAYNTYFSQKDRLNVLDVGCGSGRNLLYLALLGHQVSGIDINASLMQGITEIIEKEKMSNVKLMTHDLNQLLSLKDSYNAVISLVTLQFLEASRISSLLTELQLATANKGLHLIVLPIKAEPYSLPASFTYLPESKVLYNFYQNAGWSILEYKESIGQLHRLDDSGKPIQGLFALLVAKKEV